MRTPTRASLTLVPLAAVGVVGATAVAVRFLSDSGWEILAALVAATVFGATMFLLPVGWLPAAAVVAFAVVPNRLVPSESIFNALPPVSLILAIWVFRRLVLGQRPPTGGLPAPTTPPALRIGAWIAAAAFLAWALLTALRSEYSDTGFSWLSSFTIGMLIPLLVPDARAEARALRSTWLVVGAIAGAYAAVEVVLQGSPLWGTLYDALGYGSSQHWSVYRAEVSFGHPLFAAAFLAPPALLGIGGWLGSGRAWHLVAGLVAAVGVVATVSRGAILAVALGAALALVLALTVIPRRPGRRVAQLTALAVVGGIGVLNFPALTARMDSLDAARSSEARDIATGVAMQAAANAGWLGSGPGTSGISGREIYDVVIENSLFQLLISVGIPGLVLFLALVALLALAAVRRGDVAAAAAMAGYLVVITGFNAIDAVRALHLVLGLLVILTLHGAPAPRLDRPPLFPRSPEETRFEIASGPSRLLSRS